MPLFTILTPPVLDEKGPREEFTLGWGGVEDPGSIPGGVSRQAERQGRKTHGLAGNRDGVPGTW